MMTDSLILKRKGKTDWEFVWDNFFKTLIHKEENDIYQLDVHYPLQISIGKLIKIDDIGFTWMTCEGEVDAESIQLNGCKLVFDD